MTDDEIRALLDHFNLPTDCECDGEDCLKCSHYPHFQMIASAKLKELAPALANAALEARAERDKLQGELIGVLNRETANLVRWEGKVEAVLADLAAARAELATVKAALNAEAEAAALRDRLAVVEGAAVAMRAVIPKAMKALMATGRDGLLLADELHRADDKVRAALQSTPAQEEQSE